jgi:hypothetical protein
MSSGEVQSMALETQILSLPLGAKLDEATDPKLVDAKSAVAVCKNAIFRKDGRVEKAPGYLAETAECIAGGRNATAYLLRMHSIESNGTDVLVGGCGFDSSFSSYGEEYYNASVRDYANGPTNYVYKRIGKWFPIQQKKYLAAGNRPGATDPDSAYVASTVPSVWTAWIEAGAVKMATNRASDGAALASPSKWTLTGMTTGMERVRIIAVGAYVHVYASSRTDLRKAVFAATAYASGASAASASVHTLCGRAWHDFGTWATKLDCIIEATNPSWETNSWEIWTIGDSALGDNVIISVTPDPLGHGYVIDIHFEDGVSTVLDVTNAIDALAGANDVIGVKAGGYGTPANVLDDPGDEGTKYLNKARYSWDAIKITVAAVDVAIVAYCESTASQLELASFTAAGAAGAYGPAAFAVYPQYALALCKCHLGTGAADYGLAVVYEAAEGANVGKVCATTHLIDAPFTLGLAETAFFTCAADFASLTNVTISQELITEYQEVAPVAGLAVWAEFSEIVTRGTCDTWRHVVRAFVVNAASGALKRDCLARAYNHRLMSRALEYDRRSHVWICHESETWPVASLCSLGDLNSTVRIVDTEATWLRAVARHPDVDHGMDYGAGLGSITTDIPGTPTNASALYWWPAVCADTSDSLAVRLNRFDYLATGMRAAKMGNGKVLGGGQLMGLEPGAMRPHGFAYPPEIVSGSSVWNGTTYTDSLKSGAWYKYLAIYEYLDGNGELHQSAPSLPCRIKAAEPVYTDGQTLTITAGVNDQLIIEMKRSHWVASVEAVDDVAAPHTITIPPGTYTDRVEMSGEVEISRVSAWDVMCEAIQLAGRAVIRAATLDLMGNFYCWKSIIPTVSVPSFGHSVEYSLVGYHIERIGDSSVKVYDNDSTRIHLAYFNQYGGWYMNEVSAATSSAAAALGLGAVDITCQTESITDLATQTERVQKSVADGLYTLDQSTVFTENAAAATLIIRPLIPGEYARNVNDVQIAIYRTEADGTTYHKVATLANTPDYDLTSAIDSMSDATALTKPLAYTTGEPGDVLENTTPAGIVLCSHRDRVWCVDEEDPRFVYVSVPKAQGFAVEFTEFIKVQLPADVLALRSSGDVMLAMTSGECYAIHGQGPDATGQGEFASPRLLAAAGVDSHRAVGSLGDITIFHSAERGLWALDRSYQAQEIGKNCADLLAGGHTVKGMVEYAGERRLEMALSSGESLWLDQRHDRWTQQTGFSGYVAGCSHAGNPWHVTGSAVCYEGGTTWTRGGVAHAMTIRTAWIKVGALTGLQRVRMESILGDWRDSHTLSIKRYIDYSTTAESTRTLAIAADPGPYLVKHHPLTQRCSAVQLEISDVPPVTGGAAFRLTALELECGMKRGYMHRGKDR